MPVKPFPSLVDLTSAHIAEHARANDEPEWLVERRVEAWEFFVQAVPPEWRRTDLTQLLPEHITPASTSEGTAIQWDESLANSDVVFTPLISATRSHEQLVREKLGSAIPPMTNKFSALRAALWQDGVLLYVPRNTTVEVPLRVCYTLGDGNRSLFPYSLVVLEDGARVTFLEDFASRDSAQTVLAGPTTEIFLGEESEIRFVSMQQWGANVYHIGGQVQVFGRNAKSEWVSLSLGGHTQHVEAEVRLQGDGSQVNWYGATCANKQQSLLTAPTLSHSGSHTESHLDFRTVVTDKAYSVFDGMIKIVKGSHATTTRLEEHSIHLSPEARSDSIPGLKIDTNDVASAGHAATSGQVDDEMLFYMQSRGIDKSEAVRMIVMGVFAPALNAIPLEELRESLMVAIEGKI